MIVLLMLIGAGIIYTLLQYVYKRFWAKNLTVDIAFDKAYTYMGTEAVITETVTNMKALPLACINMKFKIDKSLDFGNADSNSAVSDNTYRNDIFALLYYQRVTRKIPVKCTKRGVYSIDDVQLVCNGIFMNDVLVAKYPADSMIIVYPAQTDVTRLQIPFSKVMGVIERNRHMFADNFMFRGIRQYETFDPMTNINWKASAKAGELMVNQYNESVSQQVCILLNLEPAGMIGYDKLSEESISIASGLSKLLIEQGVSVSIYSNGCDYKTDKNVKIMSDSGISQFNAINTALARIDLDKPMPEFSKFMTEVRADIVSDNAGSSAGLLYIIISAGGRKKFQLGINEITKSSDAMWILPFHMGMDTGLQYCNIPVTEWEVDY